MKIIVAGCFSMEGGGATAGDLLAAELVCDWLDQVGCPYDIAVIPPFQGGIDLKLADPQNYSHAIFVCGPFGRNRGGNIFFSRFSSCKTIGIDLTMLEPLEQWNPFDILIERDSSVCARPDITFLSRRNLVPVVGVCLVEPYGAPFEDLAYSAIKRLVESREISLVEIDTRLDTDNKMFRTPAEVESALARMDLVITTRLHGTVLSLKNGIPTISIDPGGDSCKIIRQAETIGWTMAFRADEVTDEVLQKAFDYCLTEEARMEARECSERAVKVIEEVRDEFIKILGYPTASNYKDKPQNTKLNRISADIELSLAWNNLSQTRSKDKALIKRLKKILKSAGHRISQAITLIS
jgi:hypothetical protein